MNTGGKKEGDYCSCGFGNLPCRYTGVVYVSEEEVVHWLIPITGKLVPCLLTD